MENHMENNFREIQKILDSCIAHDYKTKVDALFLKREYLTQAQLKDYLRQEIFRVTENIVAIQQKYRVVRNIVLDMDIPDFLWESGYFEDLNSDERKKYIGFRCSDFDWTHICMNRPVMMGGFPICPLSLVLSCFPSICAICKNRKAITIQMRLPSKSKSCQKRKRKVQILIQPRLWAKAILSSPR